MATMIARLKGVLVLVTAAAVLVPARFARAEESCVECLQKGIRAYEEMNYEDALRQLQAALKQQAACTRSELVTLHVHIAQIHLVLGETDKGVVELKEALRLNPYLSLDPVTTAPKILSALNKAREEIQAEQQPKPAPTPTPVPAPQPTKKAMSAKRIGAWTTLSVGLGSAVTSGTLLGLAYSEDALQKSTHGSQHARHWANTENYATGSFVTGGIAGASIVTSIVLFVLSRDDDHRTSDASRPEVYAAPILSTELPGVMVGMRF